MVDRTHTGLRCRTIRHISTRDGLLRRGTFGTIRDEMDNLERHLVFVDWDNGLNHPVFAREVERDTINRLCPQGAGGYVNWALAEEKGVQYAKEASGHKSDRYIWQYVKPSQQSWAAAIDELDA